MTGPNLPLEDVLHELVGTEAEASYAVLMKWRRRYPQHSNALADFFAIWGVEDFKAEVRGGIAERPPAAAAKEYALEQMRRRGRIPPMDNVEPLEAFDRLVLTAVDQLCGQGHSVNITAKVAEMTGTCVLPAPILVSVSSLEKRALVWSRFARRRTGLDRNGTQYFTIALAGGRALGKSDVLKPRKRRVVTPAPAFDTCVILREMILSEPKPSYDAVIRWCGRYPQYSEHLASFFVTWAVQCIRGGEPQQLIVLEDEERLEGGFEFPGADDHALKILRRQGRLMPPPRIKSLEPFDRLVLSAVYELRGEGQLSDINDKVTRATRVRVLPVSTSVSLSRLEKLGLVAPSYAVRETYFKITIGGKCALAKTRCRLEPEVKT